MTRRIHDFIRNRVIAEANYIIEYGATVRGTAYEFDVSKSTVHRDIHKYLLELDLERYGEVMKILDYNKLDRHNRGGAANRVRAEKVRNKS